MSQTLSSRERLAWLRLIRSDHVGPVTFRQLLARFGTADAALEALPELAKRGGRRSAFRVCPAGDAARELENLERIGGTLVALGEDNYSTSLAALEDSPPLLFVRGHAHLLRRPALAMVGARNASAAGRRLAEDLARALGQAGLVIVSGLARGIDGAAHRGSLASGTIAVVAGGLDVIYPPEHAELTEEIANQGLLVSEMPVGYQPTARNFPQRNRIVAGLALGVLVVEAAVKSGSLITARYAADQGREVMAVPGSPLDPRCQGSNSLIRQGAQLVQNAADVLESLGDLLRRPLSEPKGSSYTLPSAEPLDETALEKARRAVSELLSPTPTPVDEVIRQCQFSSPFVQMVLLELELAGRIERLPGGRVALVA